MKTFETYKNNLKNNIMNRLALLFSVLFVLNANAKINNDSDYLNINSEKHKLEKLLFDSKENSSSTNLDISTIEVIEIEEEVELGFDATNYLPENFNPYAGMEKDLLEVCLY